MHIGQDSTLRVSSHLGGMDRANPRSPAHSVSTGDGSGPVGGGLGSRICQPSRSLPNRGATKVIRVSPPPISETDGVTAPGPTCYQSDRSISIAGRPLCQELGQFLKTLEAAGKGTKTLWAHLVRQVYDKLMIAGNFCSIGIVLWVLSQLGYNGSQIVKALKKQAYQLCLATILRAFRCGIAAFILKCKYDNMLVTHAQRPSRQGSAKDVEAAISQEELCGGSGL